MTGYQPRIDLDMTKTLASLMISIIALLVVVPASAQNRLLVADGQAIANENCARCHAVGRTGRSPVKVAPRFRDLSKRYKIDDLEEAFAEGVAVGHGEVEMPEFTFSPDKTAALIAYIKSLAKK